MLLGLLALGWSARRLTDSRRLRGLALILFDGGLKTRFQSIKAVLAPSVTLATVGVLLTALRPGGALNTQGG